jgi:prepilin-type N-terminal cleavage/methylation domain-containing protein
MKAENENGFTLVEILVALIVLVMGLIPMAGVVTHFLGENLDIERKDRTAFLAQWKMEEAKIKTIAHFDTDYSEPKGSDPVPSFDSGTPDEKFKYDIDITDTDYITIKDKDNKDVSVLVAKTITVKVSYGTGEPSTTLYSKVARRG